MKLWVLRPGISSQVEKCKGPFCSEYTRNISGFCGYDCEEWYGYMLEWHREKQKKVSEDWRLLNEIDSNT